MSMFETGVAKRSGSRADPPEHLVVIVNGDWVTWCGGGPAIRGFVSMTRRRCPKCTALARQDIEENCEPDEESEFDWFLGRTAVAVRIGQHVAVRTALNELKRATVAEVPVEWRGRGGTRSLSNYGSFPKRWVKIDDKGAAIPWPASDVFASVEAAEASIAAHPGGAE